MEVLTRPLRAAVVLALLASLVAASAARAQEDTQLTIAVSDTSGARLADAGVVLLRPTDQRTVVTGADGTVTVRGLATGGWSVEASKDGFAPRQRQVVVSSAPGVVNITLEVSGLRERVIIEAAALPEDALQLDAAATGGTRLDLPVRELPATLTIISQALIQERGVTNAMEAAELAPGVTTFVDSGSIPGINMRGFSSTNGTVSVMRDGIRQNSVPQSGRPLDSFMLERVEVLKGPASLMAGEGATGGSINYVTKEPRRDFEVDTLLSYGSFDKLRVGLGVSIPFTPDAGCPRRLSRAPTAAAGSIAPEDQMQSTVAAIRWTPRPSIALKGTATFTNDSIRSYYGTPIIDGEVDPRTRFLNYNMRDDRNEARNNYGRFTAEFVLPRGWIVSNELFAATQDVEWRNFESVQFVPATRRVTVGGYFLAKRDDLLVGNQVDARKTFTVCRRGRDVVGGYLAQRNDQDRWGGGTIPQQTVSVDPFTPEPIFDPGFPVRLRPQRAGQHPDAVRGITRRHHRQPEGRCRAALGAVQG